MRSTARTSQHQPTAIAARAIERSEAGSRGAESLSTPNRLYRAQEVACLLFPSILNLLLQARGYSGLPQAAFHVVR